MHLAEVFVCLLAPCRGGTCSWPFSSAPIPRTGNTEHIYLKVLHIHRTGNKSIWKSSTFFNWTVLEKKIGVQSCEAKDTFQLSLFYLSFYHKILYLFLIWPRFCSSCQQRFFNLTQFGTPFCWSIFSLYLPPFDIEGFLSSSATCGWNTKQKREKLRSFKWYLGRLYWRLVTVMES